MADPAYEYRVVCAHGHVVPRVSLVEAKDSAARWDEPRNDCGPHRVERRLIAEWESVDD